MEKIKQNVYVDYDPISERFVIQCPFYANDALNGLNSKRWLKAKKGWGAPLTRRNVEFIAEQLRDTGLAAFTEKAHDILDQSLIKLTNMGKTEGFPAWYPFKTEPRNHQRKGLNKSYGHPGFAFYMDRGTGKTKTTIDLACAYRMEDKIDAMIVVCKLSGRRNWEEEWETHGTVPASFHFPDTTKRKEFKRWMTTPHDLKVMVIGIESLSAGGMASMMREFSMAHVKVLMAIDESHMIANHKAKRSIECVEMRPSTLYRLILTGTPISTGPMNLYMQFEFIDPDIIGVGDFYSFRNRYAVMGGYRDKNGRPMQIVGYQNIDELTATVAPYVYECRKSEVLDLPPKVFKKSYIELTKEQRVLYDKVKKDQTYEWAGKEVTCQNVLGVALRLHQICGGYITTYEEVPGPNGKIKRIPTVHEIIPWEKNPKVLDMLDYAADEKPMIIWCAYRAEIAACVAALKDKFPHLKVGEIHGGESEAARNKTKDDFQAGRITFLVGNTTTGGASLTLTACETMYYYNNTEKMIDREQSEDRAHRDGLTHTVLYVDCIAEKTVDVTIMKSLSLKVNLSDYIRDNIASASRLLAGEE
jgi:SNF2 family DNA or RNA helicase